MNLSDPEKPQFQGHSIVIGEYLANGASDPSMFDSSPGFSGSADRMALLPVGPNFNKVKWGNVVFSSFMRQYLENGRPTRYDQSHY